MAEKLATKQENTVGWAYLPNNKNVVALKKSYGSESLHSEKTALTPLSTLTTASNEAETRMNSALAGGGGLNIQAPQGVCVHEV